MSYKAIRVQLEPNNWQRTRLFQYAGTARFAYNWALSKEIESLKEKQLFISDGELRREFTQLKKQKGYEWLNEVSNDVPKQAIKDLVKAYMKYFKARKKPNYKPYTKKQIEHAERIGKTLTEYDKQGHPKYKSKKREDSYGFYNDSLKLSFTESTVRVSALLKKGSKTRQNIKSSIKLAEKNRIPVDSKYVNPRITYDGLNWYISVAIEIEDNENRKKYEPKTEGIGCDVGIKSQAILNDGEIYNNINKTKQVKKLEKKKRRLQRSISRKYLKNKKGESYQKTCNIKKAEKKLLRLNHRLTNIRHSYRDKIVEEMINRKPRFICIEDLNVSGMMKNRHLAKAILNQGLREFRQLVEHKTAKHNIPLIVADRWFPSSKICNECGCIKRDLKLKDREYKCECGYREDRDINAAKNLRDYGEREIVSA